MSKPSYIAGDVNHWVDGGTVMYPCPTCNRRGWIDTDTNEDVNAVKGIALSSMETSKNLMDECVHRGERIKELESVITIREDEILEDSVRLDKKRALVEELE